MGLISFVRNSILSCPKHVRISRIHDTKVINMGWKDEKEKLEKLDEESWSKKREDFGATFLNDIPSWRDFFRIKKSELAQGVVKDDILKDGPDLSDKVAIFRGDITKLAIDCIVNAANKTLLGGGGVDGAIHRGAGPLLLEECKTLNGCPTGDAKMTSAYNLPAKAIIHTVGPIGERPDKLKSCYEKSLNLMIQNGYKSITFPCISTGVYGYPPEKASLVACTAVRDILIEKHDKIDRVVFCIFMDSDYEIYRKNLQIFFPVKDQ